MRCKLSARVFGAVKVSMSLRLCLGEGCGRSHPAADVAGEGSARGEGDGADGCGVRQ